MSPTRPASKAYRYHVTLMGRRNAGKSSLINALVGQQVAIVSPEPGTTTDPVEKAMELQPLGPALLIDTAGLDDVGELGAERVRRSRRILDRSDLVLLVLAPGEFGDIETDLLDDLARRRVAALVVFNQCDRAEPDPDVLRALEKRGLRTLRCSARTGEGVDELRRALVEAAPADLGNKPQLIRDLVGPGEMAVLVVPIDKEAPVGRLIMPQAEAIRDLLDGDAYCMAVKESELPRAMANLRTPPKLVVTDSQAFAEVAAVLPPEQPLTGFSVLFSRFRGDLLLQVEGALAIDRLEPGGRVLVAEACTHHPVEDDIGRVKIPRWLQDHVGGQLDFTSVAGHDFPEDLGDYDLVVHCGACTLNRRAMLSRLERCREAGVPVTNYGLTIAFCLGIFERALQPFPEALELLEQARA